MMVVAQTFHIAGACIGNRQKVRATAIRGKVTTSVTPGQKVQATGSTLNLGVIKQTGASGFYKVSVSEN